MSSRVTRWARRFVRPSFVVVLAVMLLSTGCASRKLMPTPNLYLDASRSPFASVPESRRKAEVVVTYATDRMPAPPGGKVLGYTHLRSAQLIVGTCRVTFGRDLTWEQLVEVSTSSSRFIPTELSVSGLLPLAGYPPTPYALNLLKDPSYSPEVYQAQKAAARALLYKQLHREFEEHDQKDLFVYIHGYNNSFEDAVLLTAQFWHFLGRVGVPVTYTWPAGRGGLVGYTTDAESGEFTIFHLKEFLRDLAGSPDVGKIHILSHSRGTDVLTTALRELKIEETAKGGDPRTTLKLGQVIMAAPDIDTQVFGQRFLAEELPSVAEGMTIYLSGHDRALLISKWLHSSVTRLGLVRVNRVPQEAGRLFGYFDNLHFINADVQTNFIGHDFFYTNPAVSSDLILLLKEGRPPGAENGRPLRKITDHLWSIEPSYPDVEGREASGGGFGSMLRRVFRPGG